MLREDAVAGAAPGAPGFAYVLEVDVAKEVIDVWSLWRRGAVPTTSDAVAAVIYYAENDAYLPVE